MFELVLDGIPGRVFWKDRNSVFLGCNKKFAEDAGLRHPDDIVGKTDYDMPWSKEESDFYVETDKRVMAEAKEEIGIIESQRNAEGKDTWLETNKVPLKDKDGNVVGILGFYHEITEKIDALEALSEYTKNLEVKNKELEQFAHITSNDLQEPLSGILSLIDHYRENFEKSLDEEQLKIFDLISDSSLRMKQLISGLLDYCRLGHDISFTTLDADSVCKEVCTDLKGVIDESSAVINTHGFPEKLVTSELEFKTVLRNLIDNAVKFRRKGVKPVVDVTCMDTGEHWEFAVADNGIGIDQAHEEKVFAIYKRLHHRSDYGGTGIGLAHCRKIMEVFGGSICFEPNIPEGTRFIFRLPK